MKSIAGFGGLFSLILIAYIVYSAGLRDLILNLSNVRYDYIALAVGVYILNSIFSTFRWKFFITDMKMKINFWLIFMIHWIGLAINVITPIAISGGEPAKAYLLSKYSGTKKSKTLATVIAIDFYEVGSFILLDIIAFFVLYFKFKIHFVVLYPLLFTIVIGTAIFASLVYTSFNKKASMKVTLLVTGFFKRIGIFKKSIMKFETNLEHDIRIFNKALKEVSFETVFSSVAVSLVIRAVDIFKFYLIVLAFNVTVDPSFIVVALAFGTVAAAVPLLPGSIGAMEPAMIAGFMMGGVPYHLATTVVLIGRMITLGINIGFGFLGMYFLKYDIHKISS